MATLKSCIYYTWGSNVTILGFLDLVLKIHWSDVLKVDKYVRSNLSYATENMYGL
jgi:hypothetical protein